MKKTISARWRAPVQSSAPGSAESLRSRAAACDSPRRCQMRMSLSTYVRTLLALVPHEAPPKLCPSLSDRRLRLFFPLPGAERLRPDVGTLGILLLGPQVDGFFEELPL